ncbi:MAG: hypothetical protein OEY28_13450 [Nitrospira sp.]|nr:hypothetical protein [Nitrospira sp.]
MRTVDALPVFALALVVLVACSANPRSFAPLEPPESAAEAAVWLHESLSAHGIGIKQLVVDERTMTWAERSRSSLIGDSSREIERELVFSAITEVGRPVESGEFWLLTVRAHGGPVTFSATHPEPLARAEAALVRLSNQ